MVAGATTPLDRHVAAAAAGDHEAFARVIDGTRGLVSSIVLAIVRDAELSRDVAQDVFVAVWRDLGRLREPTSFLPWLRQVARHRAYHALRTERRRQRSIAGDRADALLDTATDGRPGALATLLAEEDRRLLVAVLDELPDDTREVVTLFYREGRSTAQVAALLGLSDAAVRKRLSRARAVLRESLLDRFGDAARKSAPGVTFAAAVASALTVGAPASASAAATGATSLAAGSPILLKVVPFALTVAMSAAGGIAGVLLGTRSLKRQARFPEELVGLRRFQAASIGIVWAAAVLFPASWVVTGSPWSQVVTFVAFLAALGALHGFWLPAIVAARHAIEMAEDPARARAARARERRLARLGWTAGILSGSAGLVAGLWSVL